MQDFQWTKQNPKHFLEILFADLDAINGATRAELLNGNRNGRNDFVFGVENMSITISFVFHVGLLITNYRSDRAGIGVKNSFTLCLHYFVIHGSILSVEYRKDYSW